MKTKRGMPLVPGVRTAVMLNAAGTPYYQPRVTDLPADRRTVILLGLLSYPPNLDGASHFVHEICPRIVQARPHAHFGPPPPLLPALAEPRIEFTGFVPDLRPHLAAAAAVVVPLRLGGGTPLKIVQAMAMGNAVVSTRLGAEWIEAVRGRPLLVEDRPAAAGPAWLGAALRTIGEAAGRRAVFPERGGLSAGGPLRLDFGGRLMRIGVNGGAKIAQLRHLRRCLS